MRAAARQWFDSHTHEHTDYALGALLTGKSAQQLQISVVIPAHNEQSTIAAIIELIRDELVDVTGLVDEVVVMDSLSSDGTAAAARSAGARVFGVGEVRPELGVYPGKGEALWKSQFVAMGDLLVFIDADLTEWGPHFVTGLLGPLLNSPDVLLVKGFYDRLADDAAPGAEHRPQGGRVTELVARPLLAQSWPELAAVVQPLAGEWAVRRSLFSTLPVPVAYGVEFAVLVDTYLRHGLGALAQVDLGARAHQHQSVHDLGLMAAEILAVARRRAGGDELADAMLAQFDRAAPGRWNERAVPVTERPPAVTVAR